MLVLSRKVSERIVIGDDVVITVVAINGRQGKVRLGIEAPKEIKIDRQEVREQKLASRPQHTEQECGDDRII